MRRTDSVSTSTPPRSLSSGDWHHAGRQRPSASSRQSLVLPLTQPRPRTRAPRPPPRARAALPPLGRPLRPEVRPLRRPRRPSGPSFRPSGPSQARGVGLAGPARLSVGAVVVVVEPRRRPVPPRALERAVAAGSRAPRGASGPRRRPPVGARRPPRALRGARREVPVTGVCQGLGSGNGRTPGGRPPRGEGRWMVWV